MVKLRSTTALLLSLTLALPAPVHAQSGNGRALDACGDPLEAPCLTEDGFRALPARGKAKRLDMCPEAVTEEALPCRLTEEVVLRPMRGGDDEEEMAAEDQAAEEATAEAEAEPAAEGEATAEAEVEATAEEEVAAETEAEEAPSEADVVQIGEDAEGDSELPQVESDASSDAETAEAGEDSTEGVVPAEGGDTGDVGNQAADGGDAAEGGTPAPGGDAATGGDTATAGDATGEGVDAGAETTAEAEAESVEPKTVQPESGQSTESAAADPMQGMTEEERAQRRAERRQRRLERQQAAAAAAAATDEGAAEAEVATEEVTEETSRSATEDFETAATGDVAAQSSGSSGGDDRGLSTFEKALLLGLGAVAVGSMLDSGEEIVSNSGDRIVLRDAETGDLRVLKNDDALLRQPGNEVQTETFNDGSTRTTVTRTDGTKIVTIRAADGRVVRRARVFEDGTQVVLFDDTETVEPVDVSTLPEVTQETISVDTSDEDALRAALRAAEVERLNRRFSLAQVREIAEVRKLAPQIELDAITFPTGSAAIQPSQAEELAALGRAMAEIIAERPGEVFLIEGHTDTVGNAGYNLALSDRRAETVALALTEYFDVPPENMITQGYGETQLKIAREGDIRENRRAVVRRITPLLTASSN